MNMKNTILSAIIGLATFTCMAATESQTQPEVGKPAPDFNLTTGDGSQVSLKDYHGKWVVLYFYPKDFTSGCTLEAHNFQRDLSKYSDAGAVILGVRLHPLGTHAGHSLGYRAVHRSPAARERRWSKVSR